MHIIAVILAPAGDHYFCVNFGRLIISIAVYINLCDRCMMRVISPKKDEHEEKTGR
jgi:hypothetical protein